MRNLTGYGGMVGARALAVTGLASLTILAAGMVAAEPKAAAATVVKLDPVGDWRGVVQGPGGPVRFAIHIRRISGGLAATVDHPDQGAFGLPLANILAPGDRLQFEAPKVQASFAGRWDPDEGAYVGVVTQGGNRMPLQLRRGRLATAPTTDWDAPADPGLRYIPAPAAHAAKGPTLPLGKCINMSDMLDAPTEGAWGPPIAEDDFAIIKAAGFTSVRIPVGWSLHTDASAPYAVDPAFLARVHHVVGLATAAGLNVMLNVHNDDELMADPAGQAARFAAIWRQVGASFAAAPPSVWFELLNEPHDKLDDGNLRAVLDPALKAVRATNPTRLVVIGGQMWSGLASLDTLALPDDPYVVPTFHYYDPFTFTHQGAVWMNAPPPMGRPFGSAQDRAQLDHDLARLRAYMARTGRVPVLGEYGAQDDPRVPLAQRIRYYHAISTAFASVGVQSCAWGYRTGFRLREGDHWLPGVVEAIATPTGG